MKAVPHVVVACPGESHEIGPVRCLPGRRSRMSCVLFGSQSAHRRTGGLLRASQARSRAALPDRNYVGSGCTPLLDDLASLARKWPVAIGGQGTHAIEPRLFEERNIELLDDLTALHNRVMTLVSSRMLASRMTSSAPHRHHSFGKHLTWRNGTQSG